MKDAVRSNSREKAEVPAPRRRPQTSATRVLGLQRAIGSRAVTELLERGRPLDSSIRRPLESAFGQDFGEVRIHTGPEAGASARAMNAAAYTVGSDIVFGPGRFAPGTASGRWLLAHELAHVVQQRNAAPAARPSRGLAGEHQARAATFRLSAGLAPGPLSPVPVQLIQCSDENDLGFLDSPLIGGPAGMALGDTTWSFLREITKGAVRGTSKEIEAGSGNKLVKKLKELPGHPWDIARFAGGFYVGVIEGIVSPIVDLWHLFQLSFEIQLKFLAWVGKSATTLFRNPERVVERALALQARVEAVKRDAGVAFQKFIDNPRKAIANISEFVNQIAESAKGQAQAIGEQLAHSAFRFIEREWWDIGVGWGKVIGAAAINIVLFYFSAGIGNAIAEVGALVSEQVAAKIPLIIDKLRKAGAFVIELMSKMKDGILKMFRSVADSVIKMFEEFLRLLDLSEVAAPELAAAGGGPQPTGLFAVAPKTTPAGKIPPRTTPTTVEELTGKSSAKKPVAPAPVNEPGTWLTDFEGGANMSREAAEYQAKVCGLPKGMQGKGYYVGKVQFDGFDRQVGKLLDAKNYQPRGKMDFLLRLEDPETGEKLLEQARRQIGAAGKTPIEWRVSSEDAVTKIRQLFKTNNIPISVEHYP